MGNLTASIIKEIKDLIRKYNCNNCSNTFGIIEGEPILPPEKRDPNVLLDIETGNIWYWNGNRWGVSGEDILNQVTYDGVTYTEYAISGWDNKLKITNEAFCSLIKTIISELGNNVNLNWLDVSSVIDMFRKYDDDYGDVISCFGVSFNGDVSQWDVSNVTNMNGMFYYATSFNQDISGWDVSNVTDMAGMFSDATSFNQDLSGWCVTKIATKPVSFDASSGFEGITAKQPVWGVCP